MNARRVVLGVLATILVLGIVGWHVAVPEFGLLGWMFLGPLLLMVAGRLWGEWQKECLSTRLARFRAGCCTRCGYDLRSSPERCPECGRLRERPEAALPRLTGGTPGERRKEIAEADWLLRLRGPTPDGAWRTEPEREVVRVIARTCRESGGTPNEHYLPHDPFATMIEDWENMLWLDISAVLQRELNLRSGREDCERFRAMTFGEVVKELAGRIGTKVEEAETPAGRFVSSPGRVGLLPPPSSE